jgi:hypothetical protein
MCPHQERRGKEHEEKMLNHVRREHLIREIIERGCEGNVDDEKSTTHGQRTDWLVQAVPGRAASGFKGTERVGQGNDGQDNAYRHCCATGRSARTRASRT